MRSLNPAAVIFPFGIFLLAVCAESTTGARRTGGTVLDPSNVLNDFQIGQHTRASFAAFENDDRNGVEDHRR